MSTTSEKTSELQIIVDAINLFQQDITHDNQEEMIDKYVELVNPNGKGSPFGSPNKDQETDIYEGGEMTWSISTLGKDEDAKEGEASYLAYLECMEQEIAPGKSKGFFAEGNPINVNEKNQIVGHVLTDDTIKDGASEKYVLRFHITKGEEFKFPMTIDPKLLIKKKI